MKGTLRSGCCGRTRKVKRCRPAPIVGYDPSADNNVGPHRLCLPRPRSIFALVGQRQFAARIDDASDNHRQAILDAGFFARVKSTVESKLLCQLQQRITGAVFLQNSVKSAF